MRRIRNCIRYCLIILLDILIMYVFHSYLNLILLVGLCLFPFLSVYGVRCIRKEISVHLDAPAVPMEKEQPFYVKLLVKNPTLFPLVNATLTLGVSNTFYGESGEHFLNIPIRARMDTEVSYPVVMDYCGRLCIEVKAIRLVDWLGIYETVLLIQEETECLVFPKGANRNQEAGGIYMQGVTEAMESKEKGYDFSEISGIREYIPGDKLQNIHWKLSVKKDELMVKERMSVSAMQLNVLVELYNNEELCVESVLTLADSVTKGFVSFNLPFTVYYYSINSGGLTSCYIGSEAERMQWLEWMLYDHTYQSGNQVEELFCREYPSGGTYLYIGVDTLQAEEGQGIIGEQGAMAVLKNY